jgi:hypothetical protein
VRTSPPQISFSSGELSPLLHRRFDYQRFQTGAATMCGFLPLRQGGFTRAPGTLHRGTTRANGPARLVDFEFAANDAVVLEFTDGKMRVWRYGALVTVSGSPYELVTPFPAASLPLLQWVQTADVIYITDGLRPIQRLARLALDSWTIGPAAFNTGPFRVQNLDQTAQIAVTGVTGSISLACGQPVFSASMVGGLLQLAPVNRQVPLWSGNTTITAGTTRMRYDGKVYLATVGSNSGVNPPTHDAGAQAYDSATWEFEDDGVGVVRITGYTSPILATGTVLRRIPRDCLAFATYRWSEGAWSDKWGYPSVLALFDQRLVAAASPSEPRSLWFSTVGDFQDFTPGTDADSSFAYAIAGDTSVNRILWLKRGRAGLHIGALGEEHSTRSDTRAQAIGPTTAYFSTDSSIGSRAVRPIAPDGNPMFVSKDGTRLFQIAYALEADANRALELSLPAQHLGNDGFAEIVWQSAPERMAWIRRDSGDLAVMLFDAAEDVLGWATCPVAGGFVESLCVSPDASGASDLLTMVVRRTVNGLTVRHVEEQALTYGILTGVEQIAEAVHLFDAMEFVPGSPTDRFTLPHLAAATVHAWTDKGAFGPLVADATGQVILPYLVGRAVIGLLDATHRMRTLDIQAASPDGNSMGRKKRLGANGTVALHRTAQAAMVMVERDFALPERISKPINLVPAAVAADLATGFSGLVQVAGQSGHASEVALEFRPYGGAPFTVLGIVPNVTEVGA